MIDVLVLNYNDSMTTENLIQTICTYQAINRILVVDNMSSDGSEQELKKKFNCDQHIEIISSGKNGGYGYGNNIGFIYLKEMYNSKYVLLCNPDVYIDESTIEKLEQYLNQNTDCLVVAPFMLDINGKRDYHTAYRLPTKTDYILSMGLLLGKVFSKFYYKKEDLDVTVPLNVGTVAGSLYLINLDLLPDLKVYDERMFLYCEETLLGIKAKELGLRITLLPYLSFVHKHAASISKSYSKEVQRRKLMVKSRIHLLEKYYQASKMEVIVANVLATISYLEVSVRERLRAVSMH